MSEKEKEQTVADDSVTDEMLSQLYDKVKGGADKEEEKKVAEPDEENSEEEIPVSQDEQPISDEEQPEEELDHKERSKAGRQLKGLEAKLALAEQKLDAILSKTASVQQSPYQIDDTIEDDDLTSIDTSTPVGIEEYFKKKAEKENRELKNYQSVYVPTVLSYSKTEDPELHNEIMEVLKSNGGNNDYNRILSGNPNFDAEMNYTKAKSFVLSKKIVSAKTKLPGKNATPSGIPTAGAPNVAGTSEPLGIPKSNDPDVNALLSHMRYKGMSDKEIKESLE